MKDTLLQLKSHLANAGYSVTKVRIAVFVKLQTVGTVTPSGLGSLMQGVADRASVYRTINLFEKLGIVERLQLGWKYKLELSEHFSHHHHHLTCLQCGSELAFAEHDEIEKSIEAVAKKFNFVVAGHQLEIRGTCQNCL